MIHLKMIREHTAHAPHRTALVEGNFCMSWQDMQKETESKIRLLLKRFGRNLPTQACYISHNRRELVPWLAAFATLGIPVTGLDYTLPVSTLQELSRLICADLLLVSTGALDNDEATRDLGIAGSVQFDIDSPTLAYTNMVSDTTPGDVLFDIAELNIPNRPYRAVGFTSGTSGPPKPVIRTQSFDQRRFTYFIQRYGFHQEDRFLVSMPLYHAAGNGWARLFMSLGATLYIAPVGAPDELAASLTRHNITASVMTPALLSLVLNALESNGQPMSYTLRWLLIGGKHFPAHQKQRALKHLGSVVYEYYGTTETGVNTIAEPVDLARYPDSVGRAFDGNTVKIVNSTGTPLMPGQTGTVAIASYMNMSNYGDGSANALFLDGERYLLTPDQGYLDKEGRLYLLNRSDRPDNHSHLYRLENAIRQLPCIADVALLQREYQSDSEVDCAITIKAHVCETPQLYDRLQALATEERLRFTRFRVISNIPYSPSGKVKVSDLALLFAD